MDSRIQKLSDLSSQLASKAKKKKTRNLSSMEEARANTIIEMDEELHLLLDSKSNRELDALLNLDEWISDVSVSGANQAELNQLSGVPFTPSITEDELLAMHDTGVRRLEFGMDMLEQELDDSTSSICSGADNELGCWVFIFLLIIIPGAIIVWFLLGAFFFIYLFILLIRGLADEIEGDSQGGIGLLRNELGLPVFMDG